MRNTIFLTGLLAALSPAMLCAADAPLVADTYISGANPTLNFGGLGTLNIGNATNNNVALLKFDLSLIPSAPISRAILRVFINKVGTPGSVDVLAVSSPWAEGAATGQFPPALGAMVAAAVPVSAANGYLAIDVTPIVLNWLTMSGAYPNNGFAIMANASYPATSIFLDSKENTATSHPATLDITPFLTTGLTGPAGATGMQGPTGPQGLAGSPGPTGPQGLQGNQGIQGTAGTPGTPGNQGVQGLPGAQGPTGSLGVTGAAGPQGPAGLRWKGTWDPDGVYVANDVVTYLGTSYVTPSGPGPDQDPPFISPAWSVLAAKGAGGATGPQGVAGATGQAGLPGPQGITGAPGPQGGAGVAGQQGPAGPSHAYTYVTPSYPGAVDCSGDHCSLPPIFVPAGNYVVQARVYVERIGGANPKTQVNCSLGDNTTGTYNYIIDGASFTTADYSDPGDYFAFNILGTLTFPSLILVNLRCSSYLPGGVFSIATSLVMTQVGGIN